MPSGLGLFLEPSARRPRASGARPAAGGDQGRAAAPLAAHRLRLPGGDGRLQLRGIPRRRRRHRDPLPGALQDGQRHRHDDRAGGPERFGRHGSVRSRHRQGFLAHRRLPVQRQVPSARGSPGSPGRRAGNPAHREGYQRGKRLEQDRRRAAHGDRPGDPRRCEGTPPAERDVRSRKPDDRPLSRLESFPQISYTAVQNPHSPTHFYRIRKDVPHMSVARGVLVTLFLSLAVIFAGCSSSSPVVLEYGPNKVTLREYETFYSKNSGGWDAAKKSSPEERQRFLDLLTNYKLKLQDASDRNLIAEADVQKELREYRASLASTFLIDREITDPGVRKLYERRKKYIRAEHILIAVKPDAPAADTLAAYNKALEMIQRITAGERFDSLARRYSEDPSVKSNSGDIYYFTSGQMVAPFEKAAYATPAGALVKTPVRSQFGYHV